VRQEAKVAEADREPQWDDDDDWRPPSPRSAFSERELEFAAALAASLKEQKPRSFVQGSPDVGEVNIDGSYDLRLIARKMLNLSTERKHGKSAR
jgi:hypothetical protein